VRNSDPENLTVFEYIHRECVERPSTVCQVNHTYSSFDVLLTVQLSIILVIKQLNAQIRIL